MEIIFIIYCMAYLLVTFFSNYAETKRFRLPKCSAVQRICVKSKPGSTLNDPHPRAKSNAPFKFSFANTVEFGYKLIRSKRMQRTFINYVFHSLNIRSTILWLVRRESQFTLPVITSTHSCLKVIKQDPFLTMKVHFTNKSQDVAQTVWYKNSILITRKGGFMDIRRRPAYVGRSCIMVVD